MSCFRFFAVACLALTLSACGGVIDPSKNAVENFSGTVAVGGASPTHMFSVGKNGEYFITITALSPDANVVLGVQLGQQANGGCAVLSSNVGQVNRQALGGSIEKGSYCVGLYDIGSLTQTTSYTVRVSHP